MSIGHSILEQTESDFKAANYELFMILHTYNTLHLAVHRVTVIYASSSAGQGFSHASSFFAVATSYYLVG